MSMLDRPRRIWQKSIEKFHPVGAAPFIGGVALANFVLRKDLNDVVEFGIEIGSGVFAHNRFHRLMGTELVVHPPDYDGPLEWQVIQRDAHIQDIA